MIRRIILLVIILLYTSCSHTDKLKNTWINLDYSYNSDPLYYTFLDNSDVTLKYMNDTTRMYNYKVVNNQIYLWEYGKSIVTEYKLSFKNNQLNFIYGDTMHLLSIDKIDSTKVFTNFISFSNKYWVYERDDSSNLNKESLFYLLPSGKYIEEFYVPEIKQLYYNINKWNYSDNVVEEKRLIFLNFDYLMGSTLIKINQLTDTSITGKIFKDQTNYNRVRFRELNFSEDYDSLMGEWEFFNCENKVNLFAKKIPMKMVFSLDHEYAFSMNLNNPYVNRITGEWDILFSNRILMLDNLKKDKRSLVHIIKLDGNTLTLAFPNIVGEYKIDGYIVCNYIKVSKSAPLTVL